MERTLLGVLTPSSNTVLEPVTSAILEDLDQTSAHFGRFPVTEISLKKDALAQFNIEHQLDAAGLLSDAKVNSIVWSGTSASWLGFEKDKHMCDAIRERTGIGAGSSVLAINDLFYRFGVKRFGLVTPYTEDVQAAIIENYRAYDLECVSERHLDEHRNFEFSNVSEEQIEKMIRDVAQSQPDAITIMCTNMNGAKVAARLEPELDIPIIDSTAAAVWSGLRVAGADPTRVQGWGRLFGQS